MKNILKNNRNYIFKQTDLEEAAVDRWVSGVKLDG
jgi:hypothetical protein